VPNSHNHREHLKSKFCQIKYRIPSVLAGHFAKGDLQPKVECTTSTLQGCPKTEASCSDEHTFYRSGNFWFRRVEKISEDKLGGFEKNENESEIAIGDSDFIATQGLFRNGDN